MINGRLPGIARCCACAHDWLICAVSTSHYQARGSRAFSCILYQWTYCQNFADHSDRRFESVSIMVLHLSGSCGIAKGLLDISWQAALVADVADYDWADASSLASYWQQVTLLYDLLQYLHGNCYTCSSVLAVHGSSNSRVVCHMYSVD